MNTLDHVTFLATGERLDFRDNTAASKTELAGASARIDGNSRNIKYILYLIKEKHYTTEIDTTKAYSKTVADGADGAAPTEIDGNTVNDDGVLVDADVSKVRTVSPQRIAPTDIDNSKTASGVTFTNNGDGTITVNGTATVNVSHNTKTDTVQLIAGHVYALRGCPAGGHYGTGYSVYMTASHFQSAFTDTGDGAIAIAVNTVNSSIYWRVSKDCTVSNLVFRPQFYDLTDMFGAGNEPTLSEFQAMSVPAEYGVIDAQDIPAAIRALPDWGKLGSKLIYENGKWMYRRYGAEVDGGSRNWAKTSNGRAFSYTVGGMIGGGAACVPYTFAVGRTQTTIEDDEITINPSGNVMIRDAAHNEMSREEFKEYMTGKTIRYENAEEVAEAMDVTEMMPEIMLRCAEGATIEFTNEHHVPVGNSVTYFVKIEEAI